MTRVLIVDDNPDSLYLLRVLLRGHGHAVDEAANGVDALVLARQAPPDLVISDLMMPVMDGYTLLRAWRADPALRDIPFIVYTATFTEERDRLLAEELGANRFIIKPMDPDQLIERITSVLDSFAHGQLPPPPPRAQSGTDNFRLHNEVLVHKLEQKAQELERANRELRAEIAERIRAEQEAAQSSRLLRAVVEGTSDSIFVKSREGRYLLVNAAAAAALGHPAEAIIGRDDAELLGAPQAAGLTDNDLAVMQSGETSTFEEVMLVGGERRMMQASKAPYRDAQGEVAGIIGIARDVTQRRQMEAALRLRDEAIQQLQQGILITDPTQPDNPVVFASAGVERITGYPPEEVVGRNCRMFQGPDSDPATVRRMREAVAAGGACSVEIVNYRKDGTAHWTAVTLNPVRDAAGRLIHFVGVQSDVAERRQLEEQLRQAQKMEAVGRLAGGIAHDFNNLLTVIHFASDQLTEMEALPPEAREATLAISQAGRRAGRLTQQLLGFSRQTIVQPRVFDLNANVTEAASLLRRLVGEDIAIQLSLDAGLAAVKADPGKIDQVLINLAVNARDAMPQGGRITLETRNVMLDESYVGTHLDSAPGPHVMLAVSDTGHGIAKEDLPRIFEPFFTTKEPGVGTGLGLSMVFGIVQQCGGSIHVYSEPGLGTTFKIYLPAVAAAAPARRPQAAARPPRGSETILLVEDDEAVRKVAHMALTLYGYQVITASDGAEALQLMQNEAGPLDLVLADIVMPNLSGPALAEHLRQRHPQLKVILTSGYTDDVVVRHGLLNSEMSFIQKPYSALGLARKVREVLDGAQPAS
jgi:PAS domain S-box-containing protein